MDRKVAVVGLGYVGLPVAIAFGKKYDVIGFDINEQRIKELKAGYDYTNEIVEEKLLKSKVYFTSDKNDLKKADFIIVAVPTPINKNNQPDLIPLISASETVGSIIQKGTIVVFESTVYPGATMDECVPVIEKISGLKNGEEFFVGYSPERINPGDKKHTFENIVKVVSGQNEETLDIVAAIYAEVVKAGVYRASSIEVAEAAKVIENTQRDVNIALMNELAVIFEKANISTTEVLQAAKTKWNFLDFRPGLVGGHCIGVDPYYLTHKAQELGYHPEVILSGRRINDNMGKFITDAIIKNIMIKQLDLKKIDICILGLTFKENCPDLRNTKVTDIINELRAYGLKVQVNDPLANKKDALEHYDIELIDEKEIVKSDILIFSVAHDEYKNHIEKYITKLKYNGTVFDIKSIVEDKYISSEQDIWRL